MNDPEIGDVYLDLSLSKWLNLATIGPDEVPLREEHTLYQQLRYMHTPDGRWVDDYGILHVVVVGPGRARPVTAGNKSNASLQRLQTGSAISVSSIPSV